MLANGHILVYDNSNQGGYPRRTSIFAHLAELYPVLPIGNPLSIDANRGKLFEVTPEGKIVWEDVSGFMGKMN
jgi:hypothetical protein